MDYKRGGNLKIWRPRGQYQECRNNEEPISLPEQQQEKDEEKQLTSVEEDRKGAEFCNTVLEEDNAEYLIKLLVRDKLAYAITSRNEQKIEWMFEKFGSRVRLSRFDDYYPGTSSRVCIIHGNIKEISSTVEWILNLNKTEELDDQEDVAMQMLVPKTSINVVGHGLKFLSIKQDVNIELSEQQEIMLREFCLNITGKIEKLINISIYLAKLIKQDRFSLICRNVSYEEFNIYLNRKDKNTFLNKSNYPSSLRMYMPMLNQWPIQQPNMYYNQPDANQFNPAGQERINLINSQQYGQPQNWQVEQLTPYQQTFGQRNKLMTKENPNENKFIYKPIGSSALLNTDETKIPMGQQTTEEPPAQGNENSSFWGRASTNSWQIGNNQHCNLPASNLPDITIPGFN